jgi:hypothetical protein
VAPAVAICQGCGAGCCLEHVEERVMPGHPPGLAAMALPRVEIVCPRCLKLRDSPSAGAGRNVKAQAKRSSAATLPDAKEAVSVVEALLRGERAPEATNASARGWRRFLGRKRPA